MKRVLSLIVAILLIFGVTLSLTSCESIAKAMSTVLFEMLTLGGKNEPDDGGDDSEGEDGGSTEGNPDVGDGSSDPSDDGDGEPIVLDPNLRENALTREYLDGVFGKEYTEVERSQDMNVFDFLHDTDTIGVTSFQYEYHQRFTQISCDSDGTVTDESITDTRVASFYTDDDNNLRLYVDDTCDGESEVIQYFDTALGRAYAYKHWALGEGISYIHKEYLDNFYRLYQEDTLLSNLIEVESYGYAEDGEFSYYHLLFTEHGREVIHYDIYYCLDSEYNTTAIYMKGTVGDDSAEYQSIREELYLPYDSYFDLPAEIYG